MTVGIEKLRKQIDKIDRTVIEKLSERQQVAKQIGLLKKQIKKNIVDKEREQYLEQYHRD